jgi:hypothetical protein
MGPTPERIMLAHGQDPWSSATSFASGSACSGLDPFCKALHSHWQDRSGYSGGDFYSPAIGGNIEFDIIGNVP